MRPPKVKNTTKIAPVDKMVRSLDHPTKGENGKKETWRSQLVSRQQAEN